MIIGLSGQAGSGKSYLARKLYERYGYISISLSDPLKRICRYIFRFTHQQLWGDSKYRNEPDLRYPRQIKLDCGCKSTSIQVNNDHYIATITNIAPICKQTNFSHGDIIIKRDELSARKIEFLTPRHALQQLGTEYGRNCYENIWIDTALSAAKDVLDPLRITTYDPESGLIAASSRHIDKPASGVVIPDIRFKNELQALKANGAKVVRIVRSVETDNVVTAHQSEQEQKNICDSEFDFVFNNTENVDEFDAQLDRMMEVIS